MRITTYINRFIRLIKEVKRQKLNHIIILKLIYFTFIAWIEMIEDNCVEDEESKFAWLTSLSRISQNHQYIYIYICISHQRITMLFFLIWSLSAENRENCSSKNKYSLCFLRHYLFFSPSFLNNSTKQSYSYCTSLSPKRRLVHAHPSSYNWVEQYEKSWTKGKSSVVGAIVVFLYWEQKRNRSPSWSKWWLVMKKVIVIIR